MHNSSYEGREWDTSSYNSGSSSLYTYRVPAVRRLQELCDEMNAPEGFLELVGEHLLGDTTGKLSKAKKAPELDDIITFMAQVYIRSTSHAETTILALDDVQWMDDLSWKVLQCILENSNHILIVCGSRPIDSRALNLDPVFWSKLNEEYTNHGICSNLNIGSLIEIDIRELAAIALLCEPSDLDDDFCNDIFKHSGGMPFFASEILDNCIRQKQHTRLKHGKIGWSDSSEKVRA